MCLCVTESIFCTPETTSTVNQLFCNKQLYKSINKIKLNSEVQRTDWWLPKVGMELGEVGKESENK